MKQQCDATCIDLVSGDEDPETCTKSSKVVVKTTTRKRHLGHGWSQRGTKSSRKQARAHHKRKKIQLIPLARAKGLAEVNVSANLDTGGHGQGPKALTGMHVHIIRGKHLWIIQPQSVAKSLT